jgi:lipoprotein NlpI
MNTNLCNAIKRIIAEQGEAILDNPNQANSLLAHYAASEPLPEKRALLTFLAKGYHKTLKQSPDSGRLDCKITLATKLRDEDGIDIHLCKNAIDVMESVYFGRVTTRAQSTVLQPVAPVPANHPAKVKKSKVRYIAIVAVLLVVLFVGIVALAPSGQNTIDDLLQLGNSAFTGGDYRKSAEYYSRAINQQPSALLYYNRGLAYHNLENYTQAINDFSQAVNYDREYYDAYLWRGIDYIAAENYDDAVKDLTYYVTINKEDPIAFRLLGDTYANLEKYDAALSAYSNAIAINPALIEAYNARGTIYLMSKKYDAAIREFNQALEIDPANYDAVTRLAAAQEAKDAEEYALIDGLLSTILSGGDPYAALYDFGFQLGIKAFLGE